MVIGNFQPLLQTVIYGANFGRDADTIASMAGAIAGAFKGATAFPPAWLEQVESENPRSQEKLAQALLDILLQRQEEVHQTSSLIRELQSNY